MLVKSDAFRPIKIEGNPDHPMSKGKSDAMTQGTLLELYDPDRSHGVFFKGQASQFGDFQQAFLKAVKQTDGGQGVYFLSETITSPTLAGQWQAVQKAYPNAKIIQWEPVNRDSAMAASKAALGGYMDARYMLENRRCDPVARCGFPGRDRAPGLPADGRGVRGAAQVQRGRAGQADEPDVCRREHVDRDPGSRRSIGWR